MRGEYIFLFINFHLRWKLLNSTAGLLTGWMAKLVHHLDGSSIHHATVFARSQLAREARIKTLRLALWELRAKTSSFLHKQLKELFFIQSRWLLGWWAPAEQVGEQHELTARVSLV